MVLMLVRPMAQTAHSELRGGDKWYSRGEYNRAEERYRRAQPNAQQPATYNLGNALYQQKRYDEAIKQYEALAQQTNVPPALQGQNQYNLGNSYMQKKEYQKAAESYQKALKLQPKDEATRRNLALALRQKKQQEQQQQQQQNKKDDPKRDQKSKDQSKNQDPQQAPNDDDKQKQPQQSPQPPQDLKKDEVRKMLQIMDDEERKVQQRLQKGKPAEAAKKGKDW
jgi:Ca-activated chloride channel homolog